MICVECGEYVKSLYVEYKNGYIKLTDCPECFKTADKYIEFDNVLLFIDILLLKPQAYKHLVFNMMGQPTKDWSFKGFVQRIRFLSILFEIYLKWAYTEKSINSLGYINSYSIYHAILQKNVGVQYFFFALNCVSDDFITHSLSHHFFLDYLKWSPKGIVSNSSQRSYLQNVLSLTILISSGTKLFPILMLIWPYDNIMITAIINSTANVNLIESLRIVTNYSAFYTFQLFILIAIAKFFLTRLILVLFLSAGNIAVMRLFALTEYRQVLSQIDYVTQILKDSFCS